MDVGSLRLRVQIQTYTETQDDTHRTMKTWTTIKEVWADIKPVKGSVTFDTKQLDETVTHNIIIRYQPFINSEHWLYFNSRRFRIRSVRNIEERNRYLELACEEECYAFQNFEVDENSMENPLRDLLG